MSSLKKKHNHEYSFNKEYVVAGTNIIFNSIENLLEMYDKIYGFCFKKFDFVWKSNVLNS